MSTGTDLPIIYEGITSIVAVFGDPDGSWIIYSRERPGLGH